MGGIEKLKNFFGDIPLSVINVISLASGIITILSFAVTVISAFLGKTEYLKITSIVLFVCAVCFGYLYWKKLIKYRLLAKQRLEVHSAQMVLINVAITETLFDILHYFKAGQLTPALLETKIKDSLRSLLDSLEHIMEIDTGREVAACIKLILPSEEELDLDNARVQTFVRSTKSTPSRSVNDVNRSRPDLIKDNTDFSQIFTEDLDAFYQGDLIEYEKKLAAVQRHYMNTHIDWRDHYRGTIVVPIRIQHRFLHFTKKNNSYQVIGFLCVDSMFTDAFLPRQERENTAFLQAYASLAYILLNKYQHYSSKLQPDSK